ncbi:MAG: GNAT family N-acetyltransferase [Flavipsychrobacter sp.]|nr:GNAT family N-acetyltransferase [Flavipsychrobacter sp.]
MLIRIAQKNDLQEIVDIYNQAVAGGFMTADTRPWQTAQRQEWFAIHTPNEHPIFVAEIDGKVTGWLTVSAYRPGRHALRFIKEVSYYIDHNYVGQGIGSALLAHAIQEAPNLQIKHYLAIVLDENKASIKLLEKFGFQLWGHLPGIADFDGVICGHVYYGLPI